MWSDLAEESEGERGRSSEGSDLAAEEGYEEGDSNAEEGHEGVWGEVQEALSSMGNGDYDDPVFAQGLKRRDPLHHHHPGRQCGRRVCLVYLYLLVSMCTTPSMS